jgi:lipid A 3-O-deacylase
MSKHFTALLAGATVVATAVCGAGAAQAQDFRLIDEVRLGVLEHDTELGGGESKEEGFDVGMEIISSPITQLSLIGSPRAVFGLQANSEGFTNMAYAGILAQKNVAEGVFSPDDAFYIEGTAAIAYHDGAIDVRLRPEDAEWKSHGSYWLFRTGFGAGYRFNERWSLTATFSHISNANLEQPNQGSNDVGLRVGMRF